MFRRFTLAALGGYALIAAGADLPLSRYDRVVVEPATTSIYFATVSLAMPTLARKNGVYESNYTATISPFSYTERGRFLIEISDEMLRRVERGESVEFKGRGVRENGTERRIEGKATPVDATSGKLKVCISVSKRIELIFNTTYRITPG